MTNFFNIPLVSTAISILIAWALFSLFCSYFHEGIVQMKGERGRFMRDQLFLQLKDKANGINWASLVYTHGSIDTLSNDASNPTPFISAEQFTRTLIQVIANNHASCSLKNQDQNSSSYKSPILNQFLKSLQVLKTSDIILTLSQISREAEIKSLNDKGVLDEAKFFQEIQSGIQTWYQSLMLQVSNWYKSKTQQRLFILGCLLGLVINVDSLQLFSYFQNHPESRNSLIQYYQSHQLELQKQVDSLSQDSLVKARTIENCHCRDKFMILTKANQGKDTLAMSQKDSTMYAGYHKQISLDTFSIHSALTGVKTSAVKMDSLIQKEGVPIGIQYNYFLQVKKKMIKLKITDLLLKLLGVLLSGLAVSFGAPFWFDALKKAFSLKSYFS